MFFRIKRGSELVRIKRDPALRDVEPIDEFGDEYPRRFIEEELTPLKRRETIQALEVLGRDFYLYQKARSGRTCSCSNKDEFSTPDMTCPICWGTGIVGGWFKYGFHTEVLDYTYPDKVINCVVDTNTFPSSFLPSGVGSSYVSFNLDVPKNIGLDVFNVYCKKGSAKVTIEGEPAEEVLKSIKEQTSVEILVEVPDGCVFLGIFIRFKLDDIRFKVDIDFGEKNIAATEFQLPDIPDSLQACFDPRFPELGTDDFIEDCKTKERFRITSVTNRKPTWTMSIGYDGVVRPVTPFEVLSKIP